MEKVFFIFNYYTNKKVFDKSFESYKQALNYWQNYSKDETINTLIIIK